MYNPEAKALSSDTSELIIFFHGLGSDGYDLMSLVPFLQSEFVSTHFFSPHGIEAYDCGAFGRQWFSLQNRDEEHVRNLLSNNIFSIQSIVQEKQKILSLDNSKTSLIGFSQGGVVANYLALIQDVSFKSVVSLSSYLIVPRYIKNKNTPFCIMHGEDDSIVDVKYSFLMEQFLEKENIKYVRKTIPNLSHSIDSRVLTFMVDFLKKIP